ncbi:DUF6527 family protein [Desulfosarcina widdelii]|uniref:DUF6527 family protein n=1 Tax=Desulfosarcina widdelii TaxID=947919 RepID=UPI00338DE1B7
MNSAWRTLWRYFKRFWRWVTCRRARLTAIRVEELPNKLDTNKLYLVGEGDYLWFAAMMCPCDCGHILYMGLMPDQKPKWSVTVHHDNSVSLFPSVWRKVGCKTHFWLRNGCIIRHKG